MLLFLCSPGEYLKLGILISYNRALVREACDCLKLLCIHFDLCVDASGVFCHQLGLFGTDLHAVGLQLGAGDAEIKVPSDENTELKGSSFKTWSRSVYFHACYAYRQGFLPC